MATMELTKDERVSRVSALLKRVDQAVRESDFESALDLIRKVYDFDLKNVYARAYEERILVMMMEKERTVAEQKAEQKANERIQIEVNRRLKDFIGQHEADMLKQRELERREKKLEEEARKASVDEVKEMSIKDLSQREAESMKRIEAMEQRLLEQVKSVFEHQAGQTTGKGAGAAQPILVLQQNEQQIMEKINGERQKIQKELLEQFKGELQRSQDELMKKMEEERTHAVANERAKWREQMLVSYRSVMLLMLKLSLSNEIQNLFLQTLRLGLFITYEEHAQIEKDVKVAAYVDTLKELWKKGKPSQEDLSTLTNLRSFYNISDEEHQNLTTEVTKELGLSDGTAVILVVDDEAVIRTYIEHILKQTYERVIMAESVQNAVELLASEKPSLILSDVNFGPGSITGFTFFENMKKGEYGEECKNVPLVMMSSFVDEFFVKSAQQLGVKAYLTKPISKDNLEKTVREALL